MKRAGVLYLFQRNFATGDPGGAGPEEVGLEEVELEEVELEEVEVEEAELEEVEVEEVEVDEAELEEEDPDLPELSFRFLKNFEANDLGVSSEVLGDLDLSGNFFLHRDRKLPGLLVIVYCRCFKDGDDLGSLVVLK